MHLHYVSFPLSLLYFISVLSFFFFLSSFFYPFSSTSCPCHVFAPSSHALFFPSSKHLCSFFPPLSIHSIPLLPPSQDGSLVPSGLLRNRQKSIPFPVSITLSFSFSLFIHFRGSHFLPNLHFFHLFHIPPLGTHTPFFSLCLTSKASLITYSRTSTSCPTPRRITTSRISTMA